MTRERSRGRELTTLYNAYRRGEPSSLPALPVQYADFAVWQRQWLQGAAIDKLVDYWRVALANLPNLELPTDRPRPAAASYRGGRVEIEIPEPLVRSLKALGRRENATPFMILLAAYQVRLLQLEEALAMSRSASRRRAAADQSSSP